MSIFSWLADRLILRPTRDHIACKSELRWIDWHSGRFEARVHRSQPEKELDLLVLKFPGTGGRAERSNDHPADCWADLAMEVWAINPPGYGSSPGRASMRHKTAIAEAAWNAVQQVAYGRPVLVTGNSLGSMSALYLAANFPVAGVLIRNPVPLKELILAQHGRMARIITRHIPAQLCPIQNAASAEAPAVFLSSSKDQVVPPNFHTQVIEAYDGDCSVLRLADADHADLLTEDEIPKYLQLLAWLRDQLLGASS